jgi:hypothetical protein
MGKTYRDSRKWVKPKQHKGKLRRETSNDWADLSVAGARENKWRN